MSRRDHLRAVGGFVAGLEALALGALVFVTGTLIVVAAWSTIDAHQAAAAGARAAARVVALSDPLQTPAERQSAAETAVQLAMGGSGPTGSDVRDIEVAGVPAQLPACGVVAITVTVPVAATMLPWLTPRGPTTTSATRQAVVDPHRSGVPRPGGSEVDAACGPASWP